MENGSIPLLTIDETRAAEEDSDDNSKKSLLGRVVARVKENWRGLLALVCLWFAYLMCNIAYSLLAPFFPEVVEKKGFSPILTGVIISCAPLSVVLLSPVIGYLLPYFGLRLMMSSGLLTIGGSYILLGLADLLPSSWVFVVYTAMLRLIEGAGTGVFVTATFTVLPILFPNSVGTIMGLFEVGAGLGYALGPPLGGVLYHFGGFKLPFFCVGVSVLVFILPCIWLVPKINSNSKLHPASFKVILMIFTDIAFVLLVLVSVLALAFIGFFAPTFQLFLSKQFQLEPLQVGFVFCTAPAAYLISALFVGPISDALGHRLFIVLGLMPVSLGFFLIGPAEFIATPRLWLTVSAFALIGLAGAFAFVPVFADMLATAKKKLEGNDEGDVTALIAVVSGVVVSSMSFGEFLGPVVAGSLAEMVSFPTSAVVFGEIILAQALALMGVTLIEKYTRPEPP